MRQEVRERLDVGSLSRAALREIRQVMRGHKCPPWCHKCPGLGGGIMPGCIAGAYNDMSRCGCTRYAEGDRESTAESLSRRVRRLEKTLAALSKAPLVPSVVGSTPKDASGAENG